MQKSTWKKKHPKSYILLDPCIVCSVRRHLIIKKSNTKYPNQNPNEMAGNLVNKTMGKDFDGSMESEFARDNNRDRRGELSTGKKLIYASYQWKRVPRSYTIFR